ncbi:MAG TPA: M28 family peptidase [Tepidisphaeraceae bacterium]|jgi:Zn-dependent M28 family amino/carboxypeptidase|nr:M28 family peptidase [Tepidisphaeraceae bacterium]
MADTNLRDRLRGHVEMLANEIGPRHVHQAHALEQAARYIETQFGAAGLQPAAQTYTASAIPVRNIEVEIRGTDRPDEILILGAHYDSVPDCPAANDNASGIAGTLELARLFASKKPTRTMRFVAWVNEEPPFFQTDLMGSRVYSRRCRERNENIIAMITLETIGCFLDAPGSQTYPVPGLRLMLPTVGNFIAVVGNLGSRKLVRTCVDVLKRETNLPIEGQALPSMIPGIGWSDHWSFWQEGYAAVMFTDTAPFRYVHYHQPTDTPDKIDFDRMTQVVLGAEKVLQHLDQSR